eukprot:TRINITY_DN17739_c0_g1_i2.p1 TRINITY_DN17739_c0_g1~~TRINITY_DN17739_c0_g1_i2.p1  ORF type:complete len:499 (+),score=52.99 TRINITY_DN17739_c0_g1_i2:123-1619(+)
MWARKCGVPAQWPSRIKVATQSVAAAFLGFGVFKYVTQANVGYLALESPASEHVLCLSEWPLRHDLQSWVLEDAYIDWAMWRMDMPAFVESRLCEAPALSNASCAASYIPSSALYRNLGIPLAITWDYVLWCDMLEIYGHLFLWVSACLWLNVVIHDLALLSVRHHDYVLDLQSMRKEFRCIRYLVRGTGVPLFCSLLRGDKCQNNVCKKIERVVAICLLPLVVVWVCAYFCAFVAPLAMLAFLRYPVRLSRGLVFVNCTVLMLLGLSIVLYSILNLSSASWRQTYAMTWEVGGCVCGCLYPTNQGVGWALLVLGILVMYKAVILGFRCLKGLRRANWANLLSVLFPIPLVVYPVQWTKPDGSPIQHRVAGQPVQGELAFDPFALMDEQLESGRSTLKMFPVVSAVEPDVVAATSQSGSQKDLKEMRATLTGPSPSHVSSKRSTESGENTLSSDEAKEPAAEASGAAMNAAADASGGPEEAAAAEPNLALQSSFVISV